MILEGVIVIRKMTVTRLCYYMFSFYQECLNPNQTRINAAQECLQQNSTIAQFLEAEWCWLVIWKLVNFNSCMSYVNITTNEL